MKLSELKKEKKFKVSPLYALERKNNLKALIIFSVIAAILVFITVAMFNLMEDALKMLEGMFENNPELKNQIAELIGSQNIATYFVLQAGQMWGLLGIIYAAFLGCKLVGGNLKDGSYEMLYTQNVSRTKIVLNKFVRLVINLLIFNAICGIFGLVGMLIWGYGQFNVLNYFAYWLFLIVMSVQAGAISFAFALFGKRKYTTFLSVVVAVAFYFIAYLGIAGSNFEFLSYLTPFAVVLADVVNSGLTVVNYWSLAIWTIIPIILMFFAIKNFKNTDIV